MSHKINVNCYNNSLHSAENVPTDDAGLLSVSAAGSET